MRKAKGLLCTAMIAILAMMQFPTGIQAKEVGGGETTIYVHVPETHAMQLRIGNHGALRIEGMQKSMSSVYRTHALKSWQRKAIR